MPFCLSKVTYDVSADGRQSLNKLSLADLICCIVAVCFELSSNQKKRMHAYSVRMHVEGLSLREGSAEVCNRSAHIFYKKPSPRTSTESFLIFGHILVPKVSYKFLTLAN